MLAYWKEEKKPDGEFYAVIFISEKNETLINYAQIDAHMMELSAIQAGYLGYSSLSADNKNIFISYWQDKESIKNWRANISHASAIKHGKELWYKNYLSITAKVERVSELADYLKRE